MICPTHKRKISSNCQNRSNADSQNAHYDDECSDNPGHYHLIGA
jgi:hypothetical protein